MNGVEEDGRHKRYLLSILNKEKCLWQNFNPFAIRWIERKLSQSLFSRSKHWIQLWIIRKKRDRTPHPLPRPRPEAVIARWWPNVRWIQTSVWVFCKCWNRFTPPSMKSRRGLSVIKALNPFNSIITLWNHISSLIPNISLFIGKDSFILNLFSCLIATVCPVSSCCSRGSVAVVSIHFNSFELVFSLFCWNPLLWCGVNESKSDYSQLWVIWFSLISNSSQLYL